MKLKLNSASSFVLLLLFVALPVHSLAQTAPASQSPALQKFQYTQPKMGTIFQLILYAPDQQTADASAEAAWARIDGLNKTLSDYDPNSELNRLSRMTDKGPMTEAVAVSDDFYLMLQNSIEAARLSDGAFDITVGPLTRLQRQSRKSGKLSDPAELKDAMTRIGWRYIRLDPSAHRVQLLHERMQLDVGGIAKGFTSDRVIKLLRDRGISRALCGAAGDIATGDPPPGRDDWRIAIQSLKTPDKTSDYLRIHDYGVSTSGDTYRSAIVDGKRYSHIIDPRNGLGLTRRIGVSTVAPQAVISDWAATAISIMGPEKGIAMIDQIPGAAARVITLDDQGNEKVYESKQLAKFLVPPK
jgi:thiamine biosynthesis lipoprotein